MNCIILKKTKQMKKFEIEIKWSLIFIAASLAWMFFEKTMGWHDEKIEMQQIYSMLFGIVAIAIYVLAIKDKKKNYFDGKMDWKQGFVSGSILSLFIAIMTPLSQYITLELISPNYFDNLIALTVEKKKMTMEAAQSYFNINNYIYMSTFAALSSGIVTAAVVAFFLKTKQE